MIDIKKKLYLCPPNDLELRYSINPWMKNKNKPFSKKKAIQQWENLLAIYKQLIPKDIVVIPSKKGLTELCFLGDSVFSYKNKALFSNFHAVERALETKYVKEQLQKYHITGDFVPKNIYYEGSGETMIWKDCILVGYGKRSSKEIISYLKNYFDMPVYGFELINNAFYHLDTALFPISDKYIAVYENAFSSETKKMIKKIDAEIIYLNFDDAKNFSLNSIALGNKILIHKKAKNFGKILEKINFDVIPIDISEFLKFGGGLKCLTFQHYL